MRDIGLAFQRRDDHLEVRVTGTFALQDAIDRFVEILWNCRKERLEGVLIDLRDLGGLPFATEKTLYAIRAVDLYRRHLASGGETLRFAYVGAPPIVNSYRPGLDIARGSGVDVEMFEDVDTARGWLGVGHPS
jgi:hypothetical protein